MWFVQPVLRSQYPEKPTHAHTHTVTRPPWRCPRLTELCYTATTVSTHNTNHHPTNPSPPPPAPPSPYLWRPLRHLYSPRRGEAHVTRIGGSQLGNAGRQAVSQCRLPVQGVGWGRPARECGVFTLCVCVWLGQCCVCAPPCPPTPPTHKASMLHRNRAAPPPNPPSPPPPHTHTPT